MGVLDRVGEVVAELKKDSDFLGDPKEPNQALEPTIPGVTPAACAPVAPPEGLYLVSVDY